MLARAELSRLRGELVKSDEHRLSGGPLRSELTNTQRTAARDQRLTLNAKMTDLISRQRHRVRESLFHRVATGTPTPGRPGRRFRKGLRQGLRIVVAGWGEALLFGVF